MIPTIARIIQRTLAPKNPVRKVPSIKELQAIREAMLDCLEGCNDAPAQRLRRKIGQTQTPRELWMLRNDAYQLISQQHSQAAAAERINGILGAFDGWVEARLLVRIK